MLKSWHKIRLLNTVCFYQNNEKKYKENKWPENDYSAEKPDMKVSVRCNTTSQQDLTLQLRSAIDCE